jgi:hypothetical protein
MQHNTYYRENRHSPALIRARRPYIVKNAIMGLGFCVMTAGICTLFQDAMEAPSALQSGFSWPDEAIC